MAAQEGYSLWYGASYCMKQDIQSCVDALRFISSVWLVNIHADQNDALAGLQAVVEYHTRKKTLQVIAFDYSRCSAWLVLKEPADRSFVRDNFLMVQGMEDLIERVTVTSPRLDIHGFPSFKQPPTNVNVILEILLPYLSSWLGNSRSGIEDVKISGAPKLNNFKVSFDYVLDSDRQKDNPSFSDSVLQAHCRLWLRSGMCDHLPRHWLEVMCTISVLRQLSNMNKERENQKQRWARKFLKENADITSEAKEVQSKFRNVQLTEYANCNASHERSHSLSEDESNQCYFQQFRQHAQTTRDGIIYR